MACGVPTTFEADSNKFSCSVVNKFTCLNLYKRACIFNGMKKIKTFSERLTFARLRAGLSPAKLAEAIKARFPYVSASQQSISELESKDDARARYTVEYAIVLDVNPVWLATGEGDEKPTTYATGGLIGNVIQALESLPPDERRKLASVVDAFVKAQPGNDKK